MVREKIINWLKIKKLKQITDYINVEIAPGVTLFGIINFSFAKGKIKLTPEEWDDNDKERIADFLRSEGVGISLEEFKESLKEEIKKVSEETQKLILSEIKRLLVENPLVSLEEFEKRPEIKPLLEYEFVGRESELGELHEFLENDKEVFVITGEGGFGKTRLAIEFAKQVANDEWDVYFIDRDKDFKHSVVSIVLSGKNVLLILDDASRYPERNKVVGFVQNPPENINVKTAKLLLIDRAIFKESIENELKERNVSAQYHQIENGDIPSFLREHFEIEREDAEQIEKESRGNFVIAIFLAELYRDKGRIGRQKEAIEHRIAKYKEDIREYRSMSIGDIDNILFLLSLLTPIEWKEDYKYFEEVLTRYLPEYDFQHLKAITGLADRNTDFFLLRSGERYVFKYDLIADYLLSQFINIKEENFDRVMSKFLPYMPFRISYNIFVIPRFFREEAEKAVQILGQIWIKLNEIRGQTPEYFSALVLFTGDLSSFLFFDIEKIDTSHWLSCYKEVSKTHPEKEVEVREELAMGLVNVTNRYGEAKRFDEMEACLKDLRALHEEHPEKEVREKLASGLVNATSDYGRAKRFDEMEACLKDLRALHEAYPEKEVREKLAKGLVNATSDYGEAKRFDEMEACLKDLKALHEEHPEKEVRKKLAMGLVNATNYYGRAKRFDEMEACLKDLKALHEEHPEKEVREKLAMGLVNATNYYGRAKRFDEMEACLKDLKALHEEHPEKEVREKLAMGLVNATNYYGRVERFEEMEACLKELRALHIKYLEKEVREKLAMGLVNATNYYGRAKRFDEMEACLKDMWALHIKHPEKEVREELAMGLVNATYRYGEAKRLDEMEACLKELRALHIKHPEKEVRVKLAMGLVNATSDYGRAKRFDEMKAYLKELKALHEEHPEKEVRVKLASGLFNATNRYGEAKRFDEMKVCLKELKALHEEHPEKEVRENLAKGLVNATSDYREAKRFDEMEACLEELKALHEEHSEEKEVREKLAMGLVNAMACKKPDYETLLLLYKLRFDLPDDVNKEKNIKTIEDSFMRATKERIEEIYDEDEGEHFEEFLNFLNAEIEDTELVLLMTEISERLDIRIQRKMWELLSL